MRHWLQLPHEKLLHLLSICPAHIQNQNTKANWPQKGSLTVTWHGARRGTARKQNFPSAHKILNKKNFPSGRTRLRAFGASSVLPTMLDSYRVYSNSCANETSLESRLHCVFVHYIARWWALLATQAILPLLCVDLAISSRLAAYLAGSSVILYLFLSGDPKSREALIKPVISSRLQKSVPSYSTDPGTEQA